MAIKFLSGVNVDSNTLFVDDVNNRVGIGTGSPFATLDVTGGSIQLSTSGSGLYFGPSSAAQIIGVSGASSYLAFGTVGTEKMRITSAGNVGIGTTAPEEKLHVAGSTFISYSGTNENYFGQGNALGYGRIRPFNNSGLLAFDTNYTAGGGYDFAYNGSSVVRINSSGNVGIGTTSPTTKLHVTGVTQIAESGNVAFYGGNYVRVFNDQNFNFRNVSGTTVANISVSGSSYFNGGNVGIGTTSPIYKLDVNVASNSDALRVQQAGASKFILNGDGVMTWGASAANGVLTWDNNIAYIGGLTNNALGIWAGGSEKVRITTGGNVGIGTTSPVAALHVQSSATKLFLSNTDFNTSTSTGSGLILHTGASSGNTYGQIYAFQSGNTSYANLVVPGGNVGIGTTSPLQKLHISAGSSVIENTYAYWMNGSDYNWGIGRNIVADTGFLTGNTLQAKIFNGTTQGFQVVNSSNSALFEVEGNTGRARVIGGFAVGSITPSTTAGRIDASNDIVAFSTSDRRFKENITPIANALDKVKTLTGVEFDWKQETKDYHGYVGHDVGVIAQEVQAVLPEAVRTNHSGHLSVRYEKMIALLVEAMKEQQNQIDELKAKLDGLTK